MQDCKPQVYLPCIQSIISPEALKDLVISNYQINEPVKISLISHGDNDHYIVESMDSKYVLRIYRHSKYWLQRESDYMFELEWLRFLHQQKIPVSYPIKKKDESYVGTLNAPEGIRYWALFTLAEGKRVDFNVERSYKYGEVIAKLHLASNNFKSSHSRLHIDQYFLLDAPIDQVKQKVRSYKNDDIAFLEGLAQKQKENIERFIQTAVGDEWGIIGGDFHTENVFFTSDERITLFDFDLCGYGWKAYDLAIFKTAIFYGSSSNLKNRKFLWKAFLDGYESQRRLNKNEQLIIPTFVKARCIWNIGDHMTWPDFVFDERNWNNLLYGLRP